MQQPIMLDSTLSSCKPKGLAQVISPERPKRASTCKIIGLEGNLAALFFKDRPAMMDFLILLKEGIEADALAAEGVNMYTKRRVSSSSNRCNVKHQ